MRTAPLLLAFTALGCSVSLVRDDADPGGGGSGASDATTTAATTAATTSTGVTSSTGAGGDGGAGGTGDATGATVTSVGIGGAGGGGDACGEAGQPCCAGDVCDAAHLMCDPVTLTCRGCAVTLASGHAAAGACIGREGGGTTCWGDNSTKQVFCQGAAPLLPVPMSLLPLGFVVTSLGFHTCGLLDGEVSCWGSNDSGECALPPGSPPSCAPNLVAGLPANVEDVQATWRLLGDGSSTMTTVALVGGAVYAWGSDATGQISGVPDDTPQPDPTEVTALSNDNVAVAAGGFATCVVKVNGTVQCLGSNESWELGTEDPAPSGPQVVDIVGVDEIVAGYGFFCARVEGDVSCWGNNERGQARLGAPTRVALPLAVELDGAATQLAAGSEHVCALLGDARVECWGANNKAQAGVCDGDLDVAPTVVALADGQPLHAKRIVGGGLNTCAIDDDDVVVCWGFNGTNDSGVPYDDTLACPPVVAQIDCSAEAP